MSADFGRPQGMLASVLAVVAIVLGVVGIYLGLSASKIKPELMDRMAAVDESVAQVKQMAESVNNQFRQAEVQNQRAMITLGTEIQKLQARLTPAPVATNTAATGTRGTTGTATGGGTATAAPAGGYTIKAGDTPDKIAKSHGVSVDALMKANPGLDARRLKINTKIKIPAAAPAAPAAR